jgi:hypothetical protein
VCGEAANGPKAAAQIHKTAPVELKLDRYKTLA